MGRRSGRAAAKRAAAALESTPRTFEGLDDDEPMPDAGNQEQEGEDTKPASEKRNGVSSAARGEGAEEVEGANEENNNDEDEDQEEEESAKSPTPPPEPVIRRRRLGRPPKNRPPDWDSLPIERPQDRDPDATPRRRGRGGWRGRGGRKGQHYQPTQQPIDKDGNMVDIIDDEVALPEDPEGETKVDKLGHLKGGREYRCRTFTVLGRGDRLYMLSTEPARCVGFRDSYLFFTKHKRLYKIIVGDEEKRDMIERDIIPHSYKGRAIGIVTARSVFREFGALIIVGGRRIIDDYEVAKARAEGVVEGELADPNDVYDPDKPYNKNQYVAWHGASAVYHSSGPSVPQQSAKADPKKRRVAINDVNWQLEHARAASLFNSRLTDMRRDNLNGVYDIHTNLMMYPAIMQPTHARIERVRDDGNNNKIDDEGGRSSKASSRFPPVPPVVARNYIIEDIVMETPRYGIQPRAYDVVFRTSPEDDAAATAGDPLAPFRGLGAVPRNVLAELPEECRTAFDEARRREDEWFRRWKDEAEAMCRRDPIIDKAIVP